MTSPIVQTAFLGHDAAHHAITHNRTVDNIISLVVNSCVGIGISWWNNTHNCHHLVVNSADCDPDIQFMPLIACSELYFGSVYSKYHEAALIFDKSARKTISVQHYSFLPLMMVARYGKRDRMQCKDSIAD